MITSGLSTDQAPPLWAPLRFFLTAPLMGMVASLFLLFSPEHLSSSKDPITFAFIHLITLGMIGMVILGALQQMLPVLAAAKIERPLLIASLTHFFLVTGTLLFVLGFWLNQALLLKMASLFLLLGFLIIFAAIAWPLFKKALFSPTVLAMRLALAMGLLAISLGLFLLDAYARDTFSPLHTLWVTWHINAAVFGFASLLLIGVALQVLPMFYVTPAFSKFCQKVPALLLIISTLLIPLTFNAIWGIMIALLAFALSSQKKLKERKRPIADTTIRYWQLASIALLLGIVLWLMSHFFHIDKLEHYLGLLFGAGFLLSVIQGMLYKIVPFLIWFHLTSQGYMEVPHMRALVSEKKMKIQFYFFITGIATLLFISFGTSVFIAGGIFFFVSNLLLFTNLFSAVRVYETIRKTKPFSFDMPENTN